MLIKYYIKSFSIRYIFYISVLIKVSGYTENKYDYVMVTFVDSRPGALSVF
jgi:hypothetical protein